MKKVTPDLLKKWESHIKMVADATTVPTTEQEYEKRERIEKAKADYGYFFEWYFPHYCTTKKTKRIIKCSKFQLEAANTIMAKDKIDALLAWYRSSAKSTHAVMGIPLWLMINGQLSFEVVVGQTEKKAVLLLATIQAELQHNKRFIHDFGEQVMSGSWSDQHFSTRNGVHFHCLGLGQSPRGIKEQQQRPDYIVVDDFDTEEKSRNKQQVRYAVDWIIKSLRGCFDNEDESRERFVAVNNIIHKDGIMTNLKKELSGAYWSQVNALDDDGEPTWPEKATKEYWEEKRLKTTSRYFNAEFMNDPVEEGKVFKAKWIQATKILPLTQYDEIVAYGDLSYRASGDYKALPIVGRLGRDFHIIDFFCMNRISNNTVASWVYDKEEQYKDGQIKWYIEGSFAQSDLVDFFDAEGDERGWYVPVLADLSPKVDKFLRIERNSAFFERGNVYWNEALMENHHFMEAIDQHLLFEKGSGANDDAPDALEAAMSKLNKARQGSNFEPIIGQRPSAKSGF